MVENSYYSLHNHTCSSNQRLVDSINVVEDLIQYAFDIGLYGVALTEHETVNSHIKAIKYVDQQRKKENHDSRWDDFKLILGNEIYLCRNGLNSENYDSKKDSFYHFILIALDEIGHKQLRELSTRAYGQSFMKNKMRRVPTYYSDLEDIIGKNPGHVIGSTACIGGYFGKTILKASRFEKDANLFQQEIDKLEAWCQYLQNIFGVKNFFLELQPSDNQEQIYVNQWLLKFANKLNIPAIVTTDSHYLTKADRKFHKAYLNSKDGDREVDEFYATTYMMSPQEIHQYMDEKNGTEIINQLFENTRLIGDRVQQYDLRKPFKLPYLPSEKDKKKADEFYILNVRMPKIWSQFLFSPEASDRVFIKRIIDKCETNPKYYWSQERIDRMTIELQTVWDASQKQNIIWSKYFLQVADYIKIAWDEGDTLVGCGRGSGVGFYLNYLLDIIQIDPIRENVPTFFWRFLNPQRASILDVDTDVQSNRRNKVIEALQNHYGELRVVRVGTERTEGSKSAILTAARGLDMDVDTAQYIASLIESDRGIQRSLHTTYYGDSENDIPPNRTFQEEMDKYPDLWNVAQKIEGLYCGASSHAGGVIIVDEDITETNSLIKLNSGEWVTAWDLHESEEVSK